MNQIDAIEAIRKSEATSKLLARLQDSYLEFGEHEEKLFETFSKMAAPYKEVIEPMPGEWLEACKYEFTAAMIFGNPERLRAYRLAYEKSLDPELLSLIDLFADSPWSYGLFSVTELLPNNIINAMDCIEKKAFTIHSKSITACEKEEQSLYLCLFFNNGACYQSFGLVHSYIGYSVSDFKYFEKLANGERPASGSFSRSVMNDPFKYMLLDRFSRLPVTVHGKEPIVFCSHSIQAESFDPEEYSEYFTFEEKNGVKKGSFKKYKDTMLFCNVYFDSGAELLMLSSMGLERYREMAKILSNKYDFPQEPSWNLSPQMAMAVESILGLKQPAAGLDNFLQEPDKADSEELKKINALMMELLGLSDAGKEYDLEELSEIHDVSMENALEVEAMIKRLAEKYKIDIDGGFPDYTPPPPDLRDRFRQAPANNEIFSISTKAENYISSLNLGIESIDDFLDLLDDLYFGFWDDRRDYGILMYTIHLLNKSKDEYRSVRDYGVEFLRLFWQVVIPARSKRNIARFLSRYSEFVYDVLLRVGLVEIEAVGTMSRTRIEQSDYRIRRSAFFGKIFHFSGN